MSADYWEADRFLRRVRADFRIRDEEPDEMCTCSLCWAENFAATRALHRIAAPGMSERDLTLAVWEWMHGPEEPWAFRRARR